MGPGYPVGDINPQFIFALRGKLSAEELKRQGITVPDVPFGDPAILTPMFYRPANQSPGESEYPVGLVAHYTDRNHPWVVAAFQRDEVLDLDVRLEPLEFLDRMSRCRTVLSSSLHGLILAESMRIPNCWVKLNDNIGGGNFKFKDWFSTCRNDQAVPLDCRDSPIALSRHAELHDLNVLPADLIASFPKISPELCKVPSEKSRPKHRPAGPPIFVLSYNRGEFLARCIDSYLALSPSSDIIVHDFGSDDVVTVSILKELAKKGHKIVSDKKISDPADLERVNNSIDSYFDSWLEPIPYVVTDCDIDLTGCPPDTMSVYLDLLDQFRSADCVGPMLTIADIPNTYPLYARVLNKHIEQFWSKQPTLAKLGGGSL